MARDPIDDGVAGPPGYLHCPSCGSALTANPRGERVRPTCQACARTVFHNPAVGVAVILRDDVGRVLLARRKGGPYGGMWCIPCGYVEWDEDVREAAVRELAEETGFAVELGAVFTVHSNWHDASQHTVGIWFEGTVIGGELRADTDVDAVEWAELHDLPGELAFPTDVLVIDELRAIDAGL